MCGGGNAGSSPSRLPVHILSPSRWAPRAVHVQETGQRQQRKPTFSSGLRVVTASLSVFQTIMGFVWLIYPACRQHRPDSHTGPRSERGRRTATRAGLIKFIPTNKGMSYPVSQPGEPGRCCPALARKHTTLIALACPPPIAISRGS